MINPSALLLGLGCILATCSTFRTKILLESCKIHCWICKIEPVKERPCWLGYITYGSFCPNQCNRQRHRPCIHGSSSRSTRSCSCWTRGRWKSWRWSCTSWTKGISLLLVFVCLFVCFFNTCWLTLVICYCGLTFTCLFVRVLFHVFWTVLRIFFLSTSVCDVSACHTSFIQEVLF